MATTLPVSMVLRWGVRKRGCTALKNPGSRPSRLIEKKIRVWPRSCTSMVLKRPKSALTFTTGLNQVSPVASMPTASGSATLSCR